MRILLCDDKVPDPHFGAGFPRAYRLLLSLKELGHTLFFHPMLTDTIRDLDVDKLKKFGIEVVADLSKLSDDIDVTIISRPHNMHYKLPLVKKYLPSSKTVYDTEALWYRRYDLQLAITGRLPGWAYRYDEIGLAKQVDLCYAINNEEKSILHANGVENVTILAHALDLHLEGKPFQDRSDVLVVGGILEEDSSNEDALWYYLSQAWDKVYARTKANLCVTGRASAPRLKAAKNPGLVLMNHVDNLVPLYEEKKIFVAATRFATGIPWKVHEAMAHGIPCVISKLLGHQLGVVNGVDALVADSPEEFVEQSVKLFTREELWNTIRLNAYKLIARDCDPENFKKILQTSLDALVQK